MKVEEEIVQGQSIHNTPIKAVAAEMKQVVRRSPRKHPTPITSTPIMKTPGFSKLTISGSTIVSEHKGTNQGAGFKRQGSFTILDPASGVPSADGTPKLQASLTSRGHSLVMPSNFPMSMGSTAGAGGAFNPHPSFFLGNIPGRPMSQERKEPILNWTVSLTYIFDLVTLIPFHYSITGERPVSHTESTPQKRHVRLFRASESMLEMPSKKVTEGGPSWYSWV